MRPSPSREQQTLQILADMRGLIRLLTGVFNWPQLKYELWRASARTQLPIARVAKLAIISSE